MRRLLRLLELAAFVTCVVVVLAALALVPLERSGTLRALALEEVARALGDGRAQVDLGTVRFHWSDPGLRIKDVVLRDREAGSAGPELVRIDEIRAQVSLFPPRVRRVAVLGGVVTAGPDLVEVVLATPLGQDDGENLDGQPWEPAGLPQLLVRDVEVLVRLGADDPARPLGRLELRVESTAAGTPRVEGSVTPRLGPPDSPTSPLRFAGSVDDTGTLTVATSAAAVPVTSSAFPARLRRDLEAVGAWIAAVDLEGEARLRLDGLRPEAAELRARVSGLRGVAVDQGPFPAGLVLDLEAQLDPPAAGELVWARDLGGLGSLRGTWRGAPLRADASVGAAAPPGSALDLQVEVDGLPIGPDVQDEVLGYLESFPELAFHVRDALLALDLDGAVDLGAAVTLGRRANETDPAPAPRVTLVVDPARTASLAYRGFSDPAGLRHGFPIRASRIRGRAVHLHDADRERADVSALMRLEADHPSGSVSADVTIVSPGPNDGPWPRVRMDLAVPAISVGTDLVTGVEGLGLTSFDLRESFDPRAGTARGRVFLDQPHERVPPVLSVDVEIDGAAATFDRLPAPLSDVEGSIRIRWSPDTVVVVGTEDQERPMARRSIGLSYVFAARADDGSEIEVRGAQREPALAQLAAPDRAPAGQHAMLDSTLVEVRGTGAEGPLIGALRDRSSEVDDVLVKVAATGAADVAFRRTVAARTEPERYTAEIVPDGLQASPQDLLVDDLQGWVRVDGKVPPGASWGADGAGDRIDAAGATVAVPRPSVSASLGATLVAVGPGPNPLTTPASIAIDLRPSTASVRVAGLELEDPALRNELTRSGLEGASAVRDALDRLAVEGAVDLNLAVRFNTFDGTPDQGRGALHLRDNELVLGGVRAEGLRGTLRTDGTRVDAPTLSGTVGGVEVELTDGFGGNAEDLVRTDQAAGELLRHADPDGSAELAFSGHLRFTDAELSPRVLADYGLAAPVEDVLMPFWEEREQVPWQLRLDAEDARFVGTIDGRDGTSVAVGGRFVPHDVRIGVGLPLSISSAQLDVPHAVFESGNVRALAELDEAYGQLGAWNLAAMSSTVSYVQGRLTLDGLAGGFAGGVIGSTDAVEEGELPRGRAFSIELSEPYRFDLALGFREVDVRQILEGVVVGGGADRGKLRGYLQLTGNPGDPLAVEGSGFVALEDARLWSIPVVRELFSQLGFENTGTFDWMRTRLALRDGELRMTNATAHSPLLKLVGEGTLGLDGRLDHEFDITYSLVDRLGPLSWLLYWIQSRILRLSVRGDMTRPRVIVTNPILDLFGRSARKAPRLPYPSLAEVPKRF